MHTLWARAEAKSFRPIWNRDPPPLFRFCVSIGSYPLKFFRDAKMAFRCLYDSATPSASIELYHAGRRSCRVAAHFPHPHIPLVTPTPVCNPSNCLRPISVVGVGRADRIAAQAPEAQLACLPVGLAGSKRGFLVLKKKIMPKGTGLWALVDPKDPVIFANRISEKRPTNGGRGSITEGWKAIRIVIWPA